MPRYVFSDEAGNFDFSRNPNASRYFIVCAVDMADCDIGLKLLELRRELAWEGLPLGDYFHASEDKQVVRDRVFAFIEKFDFRIYAQILEKSKAQPKMRVATERFYQYAWLYLFRYCMPRIVRPNEQLMVTTASIGKKKGQVVFSDAIRDVLSQTVGVPKANWRAVFWSAASDPCLQVADYCTWAIQKKWERNDTRSYELVKSKIVHEYELWGHGKYHHY
jgi:hypothetical protein